MPRIAARWSSLFEALLLAPADDEAEAAIKPSRLAHACTVDTAAATQVARPNDPLKEEEQVLPEAEKGLLVVVVVAKGFVQDRSLWLTARRKASSDNVVVFADDDDEDDDDDDDINEEGDDKVCVLFSSSKMGRARVRNERTDSNPISSSSSSSISSQPP
jgi:hypothetical protein